MTDIIKETYYSELLTEHLDTSRLWQYVGLILKYTLLILNIKNNLKDLINLCTSAGRPNKPV